MQIYSPRQLITAIPHIMGFHPSSSLVVVILDGHTLDSALRFDVDAPADMSSVARAVSHCQVPGVVYIDYTDNPGYATNITQWECEYPHAATLDHLRVVAQHWRSVLCSDESCCPVAGHPITEYDDDNALQFIVEGSAPFANRDELRASLTSAELTDEQRDARSEATPELLVASDRAGAADRVQTLVTSGESLGWTELATVIAGLADFRVRDAVLRHLLDEPRHRMSARVTLMDAVRRCVPLGIAPLATVLAGAVWLDGNGPLARVAIDRALECDGDYKLARLLDRAVSAGISPQVWAESLAALSREQCLAGAA